MFCYQCEQAAQGKGCEKVGVCGKDPKVAALQDLMIYQAKGIGWLAHHARGLGEKNEGVDRYIAKALFTTVTNVDFDPDRLAQWIREGGRIRRIAADLYREAERKSGGKVNETAWPAPALYEPAESIEVLLNEAGNLEGVGVTNGADEDIRSLRELLIYGLKGMAAYVDHAALLGKEEDSVYAFFHKALSAVCAPDIAMEALLGLNMECGTMNLTAMELLDAGHTERFGHPEPTPVRTGLKKGPAIIITGHDLVDLEALLKQTEGTGINIYTHGEMLPAHGYPGLRKYTHLAGHFGTAWQNQRKEFDGIPAAILFTTNCIQKPKESYMDRVYTTGLVAWPGITHVKRTDFSAVIEKAKALGGSAEDQGGTTLTTGFARNAVLSVADKVVGAVKSGAIKHFFLVGGCDGAKPGRNYYTEFVEKAPKDTVILTLACGKFRFNHLDLGDIGGIPRLLDIGQCNDAYSAIKIASALAEAFDCGVNDLPLSFILSWYEQKAVVILLSLLALGIKGIRIGPTLPAFLSPNVVNYLVENFDVKPISTPCLDLAEIMEEKVCTEA
ncbi:MAG: hydroxylamine reductase [Deltaproteobacteria bacterium]|nr:hydroxylamine reductase [Deltaproteobacteria bacterium]